MKDAFYFSHDSNARADLKIQALRSKYGMKGYGMYWVIIEMMRESKDHTLPLNQNFAYFGFANEFGCKPEEAKEFIHDCIYQFALFVCNEECFWSDSLNRRMDKYKLKLSIKAENGTKGGRPRKEQQKQPQEAANDHNSMEVKTTKQKTVKNENATVAQEEEKQDSEEVIYLTDLLIQMIKANNPQAKTPADIKKWRNDIRLLIADGYSFNQIDSMIKWCQDNDFWKSNILSAKKLREKANTLVLQMNRNQKPKAKTWSEEMQELMDWAKGEDAENDEGRSNSVINVDFVKL